MDNYKNDDNFDGYYEYEDRAEPVCLAGDNFSERVLADVLMDVGLIPNKSPKYVGTMSTFVLIHGERSETYSDKELWFMEQIKQVFVYPDFLKKLNRSNVPCRVIVTKFDCKSQDALLKCLYFEKIINKALDGFNIFFFIAEDGVFFGCRLFNKQNNHDCTLSKPITDETRFRQILDNFLDLSGIKSFIEYYDSCEDIITFDQTIKESYEEMLLRKKGLELSHLDYIDKIDKLGKEARIDVGGLKRRFFSKLYNDKERPFLELLEEAEESLSFIKSNRVNTYEILLEFEEMANKAEKIEESNREIMQSEEFADNKKNLNLYEEAKDLLDNPEELIRFLKNRKGL